VQEKLRSTWLLLIDIFLFSCASSSVHRSSKQLTEWLIRKVSSTMEASMTWAENKKVLGRIAGGFLAVVLSSAMMVGQASPAARYDQQIESGVAQKLAAKNQFHNVKSSAEDGIVTLAGNVDLYQYKLDAAKTARKIKNVQGVRNLIEVAGPNVPDQQLEQRLATKLRYVRVGYDNAFDYFAIGVRVGVVTVEGQDRTGIGRDEALADIANMPGVKDVIDQISVEPVSIFDDGLRLRTARTIYADPVLSKYALDPARPIRIIIANGHVTLYGVVDSTMDKQIAGIRANQIPGAFSVDNQLQVASKTNPQPGM
jgi:hyperosmotically inducible periplasmic protein